MVHLARNAYTALPRDVVAGEAKDKLKTILKSWAQISSIDNLETELSNARAGVSREDAELKKVRTQRRNTVVCDLTNAAIRLWSNGLTAIATSR